MEAEVAKLIREASRNTEPKKHHLVPKSYLRRWAIDGVIRFHRIDEGESHTLTPAKAARQTDYYRLESDGINPADVPPMFFETILSRVEAPAVRAIDDLMNMSSQIDGQARYDLATFLAFQNARGHGPRLRHRAMVREVSKTLFSTYGEEQVREIVAKRGSAPTSEAVRAGMAAVEKVQSGELVMVPQDAQTIASAFGSAKIVARLLFERGWVVARTSPVLITTDEPVLSIGGPGAPRTEASGVGTAGIVAFPLSPDRVLLLLRKDLAQHLGVPIDPTALTVHELDLPETTALNRELAMSATRWAFERPDSNVVGRLAVPRRHEDAMLEEVDMPGDPNRLFHLFRHTRWENARIVFDWPLSRFWPAGWRSQPVPEYLEAEFEEYRRSEGGD